MQGEQLEVGDRRNVVSTYTKVGRFKKIDQINKIKSVEI